MNADERINSQADLPCPLILTNSADKILTVGAAAVRVYHPTFTHVPLCAQFKNLFKVLIK